MIASDISGMIDFNFPIFQSQIKFIILQSPSPIPVAYSIYITELTSKYKIES